MMLALINKHYQQSNSRHLCLFLSWRFCTKGYDIQFGVFRELNSGRQEVVLKDRVYSHLVVETGKHVCRETGVCE